jgi:hypothetical protein
MGSNVRLHLAIPGKIGLVRVYCLNNMHFGMFSSSYIDRLLDS